MVAVRGLAPDLSMFGYLVSPRVGATAYNLVHSYVLPVSVAAVALGAGHARIAAMICIWTAHIGLDRLLGDGLKYPSAFGYTHLGRLGNRSPGAGQS